MVSFMRGEKKEYKDKGRGRLNKADAAKISHITWENVKLDLFSSDNSIKHVPAWRSLTY